MTNRTYLDQAFEKAHQSLNAGGFPAGVVVVRSEQVVGEGISIGNKHHDPTDHAEIAAIRDACSKLNLNTLADAVLYSSLEPCFMCLSAAFWAGIPRIVYGAKKNERMVECGYYEGSLYGGDVVRRFIKPLELVYEPDYQKEAEDLIKQWEEKKKS